MDASASRRTFVIEAKPRASAQRAAVVPRLVRAEASAPRSTSRRTTPSCPKKTARTRGVKPSARRARASAPASSRTRATSSWPRAAARMSGVSPPGARRSSADAPEASSRATSAASPPSAAANNVCAFVIIVVVCEFIVFGFSKDGGRRRIRRRGQCRRIKLTTNVSSLTTVSSDMPDSTLTERLRALPSIDALLRTPEAAALRDSLGAERLTALARAVADELRAELRSDSDPGSTDDDGARAALLAEAARRLLLSAERERARGLRRVINATGVVLHTNLGRAPLSDAARRAVAREAAGYCTLEYDTETGARGRRGARAEALVVNNCAAAALLVLTALARDGEAVVSRGELVEIGGDFRVPDVMAQSGTAL